VKAINVKYEYRVYGLENLTLPALEDKLNQNGKEGFKLKWAIMPNTNIDPKMPTRLIMERKGDNNV
jgi:hypothetical protein